MLNNEKKTEFLAEYKNEIEKIDKYIKDYLDSLEGIEENLKQSLYYAVLNGGKRLRSILCIKTGQALGARDEELYPFAMAIEFIHAYSLVHDDLPGMDNADMRRGMPSCHKKYGVGPAVLTGDGLLNLAYEVMTKACLNASDIENALKAMEIIGRCAGVFGMINGQALDLKTSDFRMCDEKTLVSIIEQKTMALIRCSVLSGAYIAGADENVCKKLDKFAYNLGLAFQIRDDFEDEEEDCASNQNSPNFINILGRDEAKKWLDRTAEFAKETIHTFEKTEFLQSFLEYLF